MTRQLSTQLANVIVPVATARAHISRHADNLISQVAVPLGGLRFPTPTPIVNNNANANNVNNNNNQQQGNTVSFSITHVGNGNFQMTLDGKTQTFNLADLNMFLRMEQIAGYDAAIADQLSEIQATNQERKVLNGLMNKVRGDVTASFALPGHTDTTTRTVTEWFAALGITSGDKDTKVANLKNAIDNLTSDSEMQMLRFRQMVDKRGTALQEARTTLTDDKRNKEKALQG